MPDLSFPIPLDKLIPQRKPFVLVDSITLHQDDLTETSFLIDAGHILVEEGLLSAYGLLENMAQSAAMRSGFEAHNSNKNPKTGFIGTITNANIYQLPSVNTEIRTKVIQTTQIMNIIVIECQSFLKEDKLADCSMKIVLMDEGPTGE